MSAGVISARPRRGTRRSGRRRGSWRHRNKDDILLIPRAPCWSWPAPWHRQDARAHHARLAHLLLSRRDRAWPSEILAVTFTNKAAREMRERVDNLWASQSEGCRGSAPSIRSRRRCCAAMPNWSGLKPNFTILDTDDQLRLMKQLITAAEYRRRNAGRRASSPAMIDKWKNRGLTPDKLDAGEDAGDVRQWPHPGTLPPQYQAACGP
jgi:superfamily I DNA/RNA helicase